MPGSAFTWLSTGAPSSRLRLGLGLRTAGRAFRPSSDEVAQDGEEHAERERADPHRDGSPARRRPSLRGDQLAGTAGVDAPDLPGVAGPVQDQGALAGRAASAIQLLVEANRNPSDSRRTGTSDPSLPDLQPAEVAQPAVVMTAGQQGSGDADRSDPLGPPAGIGIDTPPA